MTIYTFKEKMRVSKIYRAVAKIRNPQTPSQKKLLALLWKNGVIDHSLFVFQNGHFEHALSDYLVFLTFWHIGDICNYFGQNHFFSYLSAFSTFISNISEFSIFHQIKILTLLFDQNIIFSKIMKHQFHRKYAMFVYRAAHRTCAVWLISIGFVLPETW